MSLVAKLYNNILRRSSTYALAIVSGAFFFERGFDMASEHIYNEINKGVSRVKTNCRCNLAEQLINFFCFQKLWKDIKHNYAPAE